MPSDWTRKKSAILTIAKILNSKTEITHVVLRSDILLDCPIWSFCSSIMVKLNDRLKHLVIQPLTFAVAALFPSHCSVVWVIN